MNTLTPDTMAHASPAAPPVATAEAQSVVPLLVSGIKAVARSRLLTVPASSLLVEVAALLSSADQRGGGV